jgi:hypothetical protein
LTVTGPHQGKPEIGVYETTLEDAKATTLRDRLKGANYTQYKAANVLKPEMATTVVGLVEAPAEDPDLRSFPRRDVPPALLPVITELEAAVGELRQHPKHVVSGSAVWEAARLTPNEDVAFTVTLKNIGTDAVKLDAPGAPADDDGKLPWTLLLAKGDDKLFVELTKENLHQDSSKKSFWSKKTAVLKPGEESRVSFKKRVHLVPGSYRGQLTFVTKGGDAESHVGGRLQIELGPLTVSK